MFRKPAKSGVRGAGRSAAAAGTSLIAADCMLQGDVRFSGALHVCGCVRGNLVGEGDALLTLSEHGRIEGNVQAPQVIINGQVRGEIRAGERLQLAAGARVEGDVHYRTLEMAAGAQVNGRMLHAADETPQLPAPTAADGT